MKRYNVMSRKVFVLLNIFWISAVMPGFIGKHFENLGGMSCFQSRIFLGVLAAAAALVGIKLELKFRRNYQSIFWNVMAAYGPYNVLIHFGEDIVLIAAVLAAAMLYLGVYTFVIMKKPIRKVYHVRIWEKDGRRYVRHIIDRKRTIEAEKRIRKHRVRLIREIAYVVFAMAMTVLCIWWESVDIATVILLVAVYLMYRAAVWLYGGRRENWKRVFVGGIVMAMVSMSVLPAVLDAVESRNTKTLAAGSEITGEMHEEMDSRQIMLAVYDEIPGKLRDEIWSELDEHEREAVVLTIAEIEKQYLGLTDSVEVDADRDLLMQDTAKEVMGELLCELYTEYQREVIELYYALDGTERMMDVFEDVRLYEEEENIIECVGKADLEMVYQKNAEIYAGKVMEIYYEGFGSVSDGAGV